MYIIQISSFQTTKGVDRYKKYRKVDRIITFARYYFILRWPTIFSALFTIGNLEPNFYYDNFSRKISFNHY